MSAQQDPKAPDPQPRDWRAFLLAALGLLALAVIVLVVVESLPGNVATNVKNTRGENAVAIGSAACTAVVTIVTAYLGVKVANVAREDAVKTAQKTSEAHQDAMKTVQGLVDRLEGK